MLSILSKHVPYSDTNRLVYYYEEGNQRFVLSTFTRTQKLDDSMFANDFDKMYVKGHLGRIAKVLKYNVSSGTPLILSNTIYGLMIFMFISLLALLVCSDDFLNISFISSTFIYWLAGDLVFFLGLIFFFGYRYYMLAMDHLSSKGKEISSIIAELNRDSKAGFKWELGEHGLWIGLTKDDLVFVNDCPEDLDNEIELDEENHGHEGEHHDGHHNKHDHSLDDISDEKPENDHSAHNRHDKKHGHH